MCFVHTIILYIYYIISFIFIYNSTSTAQMIYDSRIQRTNQSSFFKQSLTSSSTISTIQQATTTGFFVLNKLLQQYNPRINYYDHWCFIIKCWRTTTTRATDQLQKKRSRTFHTPKPPPTTNRIIQPPPFITQDDDKQQQQQERQTQRFITSLLLVGSYWMICYLSVVLVVVVFISSDFLSHPITSGCTNSIVSTTKVFGSSSSSSTMFPKTTTKRNMMTTLFRHTNKSGGSGICGGASRRTTGFVSAFVSTGNNNHAKRYSRSLSFQILSVSSYSPFMSSSSSTNLLFSSSSSPPPVSSSKGDSGGNGNNDGVPATFDANAVLAVDPSIVNIMTVYEEESKPEQQQTTVDNSTSTSSSFLSSSSSSSSQQLQQQLFLQSLPFVDMFRGSANYIANHRNTIAVYHIPGGLVDTDDNNITSTTTDGSGSVTSRNHNTVFRDLMNDVALTWLLGMRIVIVAGCRQQIEKRITKLKKGKPAFTDVVPADVESSYNPQTLRVTDENILRIVKEEAGYVRFEVERELARSLRMQGGASTLPTPISLVTPTIIMTNNNNNNFTTTVVNGDDMVTTDVNGGTATTTSGSIIGPGARVPSTGYDGNVVSGNFYSAQPFGILNGIDYKFSGFVRRVEVEKIKRLHDARDICLLTSLGVSPSGEVFNVNSESLAATVAGELGASKVLYFTEHEMVLRHAVHNDKIHSLRCTDARNLLRYHNITINGKGYVSTTHDQQQETTTTQTPTSSSSSDTSSSDSSSSTNKGTDATSAAILGEEDPNNNPEEIKRRNMEAKNRFDMLTKIGWCIEAVAKGVKRAHIISPKHGALLQELYTRDGSGVLISADLYEGISRATYTDVAKIHELILPLIEMGTLIDRPISQLEKDIDTYYVYKRDDTIVACGQLKMFEDGYAEIGCLVVNKVFRSRGRGDAMLGYLERLCLVNQRNKIFVLSTQTMEWFIERGFKPVTVDQLPLSRQSTYNRKRASKIYLKEIQNERDLDASELWWNR